jgi:hypothetical protein
MNEQQLAAVKQALEALENGVNGQTSTEMDEAITALQSIISQDALDKKAENARELGLDYEPAPKAQTEAEKTAYAFGWCKAMKYARQNGVITSQPVPVKTYHDGKPWPVAPKPWVGLTNNELQPIADEYRILFGGWVEEFARAIEAKLKEKNHV